MPNVRIRGHDVDVDVRTELEAHDFERGKWTSDKLIAASPFRNSDSHPSFFCNLDGEYAGTWGDSGADDSEFASGNLTKLLAFLREETYEETEEYLLDLYAPQVLTDDAKDFRIPSLKTRKVERKPTVLDEEILTPYQFRHGYLEERGISEKVQRFMGVGYSQKDQAVTLPWRHADGSLANMKYRKVFGKYFWYYPGGEPIKNLVYGAHYIYAHNITEAVVCEAEIDALTWLSVGKPAIALGGSKQVTERKLDIIRKSPLESVIICADNDGQGEQMRRKLIDGLRGYAKLRTVRVPSNVKGCPIKDANEAHCNGVDLARLPAEDIPMKFDISCRK